MTASTHTATRAGDGAAPGGRGRSWWLGAAGVVALLGALPPFSVWPLALLAPWPLAQLAREAGGRRRAFARLFVAGLFLFTLGNLWILETSVWNLPPIVVVESFWLGLFGVAARGVLSRWPAWPALPMLWTGLEFARLHFPESGYPWQFLGMALAANPVLVQAADLQGVMGLGFVAASVAGALMAWRAGSRTWVGGAVLLVAAVVYGLIRPTTLAEPQPGPLLAGIQPAFPQVLKDGGMRPQQRYDTCVDFSRRAFARDELPELLIWPETMWPWPLDADPAAASIEPWYDNGFGPADARQFEDVYLGRLVSLIRSVAGDTEVHLLLGAAVIQGSVGDLDQRNSAMLFGPEGRRLARYDKTILVPGGEHIPFEELLPQSWIDAFAEISYGVAGFVATLTPGDGPRLMDLAGTPFGVTICYENAYGGYHRRYVEDGARFLVNISNEAWFGTSSEHDHMELHAILRAVETRRALFRSTNSGVSSLVLPDGQRPARLVVSGSDRAVGGTLVARVPLHSGVTPYVRLGDVLAWACLALAGLGLFVRPGGRVP